MCGGACVVWRVWCGVCGVLLCGVCGGVWVWWACVLGREWGVGSVREKKVSLAALLSGYLGKSGHLPR